MKAWKKLSLSIMGLILLSPLAACQKTATINEKEIPKIPLGSEIQTLDPAMLTDSYSMNIAGNVQEGLTRSSNNQVSNALAKSIDISKDGLTCTVKLRDNLKWSNGDALTAKDFVYAWRRVLDSSTASQYAFLFEESAIKNAKKILLGQAKPESLGVELKSDTEMLINLERPVPYLKNLFSMPVFFPVNQRIAEKYGKQFGTNSDKMVYCGPFYFKKGSANGWTGTNATYMIEKNPNYWDAQAVKAKAIKFQVIRNSNTGVSLYRSGKLDFTGVGSNTLFPMYQKDKNLKNIPVCANQYFEFNQSGKGTSSDKAAKALQNYNIRKAIVLATDRQSFVDSIAPACKIASGFTPIGAGHVQEQDFSEYAKQDYKYDVAEAKTYWEKGLKELGFDSLTLSIETDSESATGKQTTDFMQKCLENALPGLKINERLVPFQQRLKDAHNSNFDIIISLWAGDYSEPSTFLKLFLSSSNYGKFVNKAYKTAMDKASNLPDVADDKARYVDYKAAERALYDEASIDPIIFQTGPIVQNPKLKGLCFNATGLQYDLKEAYIEN